MPADVLRWIAGHPVMLGQAVEQHLWLSAVALAAVLVLAFPLGIALGRRGSLAAPIVAVVNTLRTIPSLALLVLMLPVLGTGFLPSAVALALYGLPAVLLNTIAGIQGVDRDVVEAARGQGLSEGQILGRIEVPLALPVIVAGVRTAAVQIVSAATLAVFIGGGGLGELISAGMGLLDIPQLIVGAGAVALLAVLTEMTFGSIEWAIARTIGRTGP